MASLELGEILVGTIWILFIQALPGSFVFLPVLVPAIGVPIVVAWIVIIVLGVKEYQRNGLTLPLKAFSYILPVAFGLIVTALLGVLFWETSYDGNSLAMLGAGMVTLLNLIVIAYAVYKEKTWRMTVLAVGIFFALWSICTLFITSMAINGTWL